MYIVRIERRMERILTRPCAARSTLVYLERGGVPRCTKSVESVNQASWRGKWCPGEVLDPSHKQRCIIWNAWCEILHILRQLNAEPCPAWTTERGKLKRGWSPGDSLNLVRVLSVRVNYSQQRRNDINGRWEYSKSITVPFTVAVMSQQVSMSLFRVSPQWIGSVQNPSFLNYVGIYHIHHGSSSNPMLPAHLSPPLITGREKGTETCGEGNVFPSDDLWLIRMLTRSVYWYIIIFTCLTNGVCHLYVVV